MGFRFGNDFATVDRFNRGFGSGSWVLCLGDQSIKKRKEVFFDFGRSATLNEIRELAEEPDCLFWAGQLFDRREVSEPKKTWLGIDLFLNEHLELLRGEQEAVEKLVKLYEVSHSTQINRFMLVCIIFGSSWLFLIPTFAVFNPWAYDHPIYTHLMRDWYFQVLLFLILMGIAFGMALYLWQVKKVIPILEWLPEKVLGTLLQVRRIGEMVSYVLEGFMFYRSKELKEFRKNYWKRHRQDLKNGK